ncbi:MAG: MBL fold metallo-hydrolase [Balneolaceae bacterium]|nr:MBL fold metallo-hydrolase [Balneolaceae bacterium]
MKYGGNTTCVEIDLPHSEEILVLDCGTGFRNLGNRLCKVNGSLRGRVFITHPHWDHLQGFPFFKPFYNSKNWFRVYIPPQGDVGCKEILQGHMSSTFFPVSVDMLEADLNWETFVKGKRDFEHFSIDYMWANHTVPTAIYKFTIGERVIVFAPDNELPLDGSEASQTFIEKFRSYIRGVDVLIHDAQFNDEEYAERIGWGHSSWEQVIPLAKEEGIHSLYLTHHDPDHSDDYLQKMDERVNSLHRTDFEDICFAKEGQAIHLPV